MTVMNDYPQGDPVYPQYTPPQKHKGWFGRNWWWFVPLIVVLPVTCCCCLPFGGAMLFQSQVLKVSPYVLEPVALAESDNRVTDALGTPLAVGTPTQSERTVAGTIYMDVEFEVTGPDGSGIIRSQWDLSNLISPKMISAEITIDDTGEVIDLLDNKTDAPEEESDSSSEE
ncbi:MAG: cytochrome c oxidase assembly factor Coa1 family protein [Planctomycetota bacterium]